MKKTQNNNKKPPKKQQLNQIAQLSTGLSKRVWLLPPPPPPVHV